MCVSQWRICVNQSVSQFAYTSVGLSILCTCMLLLPFWRTTLPISTSPVICQHIQRNYIMGISLLRIPHLGRWRKMSPSYIILTPITRWLQQVCSSILLLSVFLLLQNSLSRLWFICVPSVFPSFRSQVWAAIHDRSYHVPIFSSILNNFSFSLPYLLTIYSFKKKLDKHLASVHQIEYFIHA